MSASGKISFADGVVDYYARHVTPVEARVMKRFCRFHRYGHLTTFFNGMSRLGDGPLWGLLGIALLAADPREYGSIVAVLALAIAVNVAIFTTVKKLVGCPRPFETWDHLKCIMLPPDRFSFPSGHTMTSFTVLGVLHGPLPGVCLLILPAAVAIGLSRVYLGLHYPTDVLIGALLGSMTGLVVGGALLNLVRFS